MSLYSYHDTYVRIPDGNALPSEAMSYGGVYLENEIEGYRTLYVTGRELYGAEIKEQSTDTIDGSNYIARRYPPRTITVAYQLLATSDKAFRDAYNKMNRLLNGEQVKVIFNDEPDKYFIGTKKGITQNEKGTNFVVGEIEIYCTDPIKYSTTLKEVTASKNSNGELVASIENDGSMPATVDYEITANSDTGYIGIVSNNGIMQFGKIDEADGETVQQNETLGTINDLLNCADDTMGTIAIHPKYGVKGTLAKKTWFNNTFLGFGSEGTIVGDANGGLRTFTFPADSNGDSDGAVNFYSYFHILMWASRMGQTGEMDLGFLTADNKLICGVNWYKTDTSGNTGCYDLIVNGTSSNPKLGGKVLRTWSFQTNHLHSQNPWYWDWGHCDIRKEGADVTFFYWGSYYKYHIPEIEKMKCAKVQVSIKAWKNRTGNKFLYYLGLNRFTYQKMHVDKWKDIPNRFNSGDVITIDGDKGKFYVNGMNRQQDEILGTKYFKADPGTSEIKFQVSEWTKTDPTIKVYIREAWL